LNRSYEPVRVTSARGAFEMLYVGRGFALDRSYEAHDFESWRFVAPDDDDEMIGTLSGPIVVPRLLLLRTTMRVPTAEVRLSRRNVFLRDEHTCQYCGRRGTARELNLDHVVPRSRGGPSTWENLVTSCRTCNLEKGRHLPAECGMFPDKHPARPPFVASLHLVTAGWRFPVWEPFLSR
jgi:hypothetical protein